MPFPFNGQTMSLSQIAAMYPQWTKKRVRKYLGDGAVCPETMMHAADRAIRRKTAASVRGGKTARKRQKHVPISLRKSYLLQGN